MSLTLLKLPTKFSLIILHCYSSRGYVVQHSWVESTCPSEAGTANCPKTKSWLEFSVSCPYFIPLIGIFSFIPLFHSIDWNFQFHAHISFHWLEFSVSCPYFIPLIGIFSFMPLFHSSYLSLVFVNNCCCCLWLVCAVLNLRMYLNGVYLGMGHWEYKFSNLGHSQWSIPWDGTLGVQIQ